MEARTGSSNSCKKTTTSTLRQSLPHKWLYDSAAAREIPTMIWLLRNCHFVSQAAFDRIEKKEEYIYSKLLETMTEEKLYDELEWMANNTFIRCTWLPDAMPILRKAMEAKEWFIIGHLLPLFSKSNLERITTSGRLSLQQRQLIITLSESLTCIPLPERQAVHIRPVLDLVSLFSNK